MCTNTRSVYTQSQFWSITKRELPLFPALPPLSLCLSFHPLSALSLPPSLSLLVFVCPSVSLPVCLSIYLYNYLCLVFPLNIKRVLACLSAMALLSYVHSPTPKWRRVRQFNFGKCGENYTLSVQGINSHWASHLEILRSIGISKTNWSKRRGDICRCK